MKNWKKKELDITTQIAYQRQAETSATEASQAARTTYGKQLNTGIANVKSTNITNTTGDDSYDPESLNESQREKVFGNLLSNYDKLLTENNEWTADAREQIKNILISRHGISEEAAVQYAGNIVAGEENKNILIQD